MLTEERKKEVEKAVEEINKIVTDNNLSMTVVHTVTFNAGELLNPKFKNESNKKTEESLQA